MDKFLSDPAGRLYRFLEHCEQENGNVTVLQGWRRYLELPATSSAVEILSGVAPFFPMPKLIVEQLKSMDDAEEHLDDFMPALEAASEAMSIAAESTVHMTQMQRRFTPGHVQALRHCSRVLQRLPSAGVPSDDQLNEVRESAQSLVDAILDATDLPAAVRETLLGYANAAIHDVDFFRVGGIDALVREANRFRGQVDNNPGSMLPPAKEEGVWANLKRFAAALGIIVAISHAPLAIGEDIKQYRQELLSVTSLAPAELVAPAPVSADALTDLTLSRGDD